MGNSSSNKVSPSDLSIAEDFHGKYVLGKKLGKGAFAQVYVAVEAGSEGTHSKATEKAVKILDLRAKKDNQSAHRLQKQAYEEACVWSRIGQHSNVVQLIDTFYDAELCYMVMEKCSCGLYSHLERTPEINERMIGGLIAQMLVGIAHVHSLGIVHRDVKPDNFLMGGQDGQVVKLADFGLSKALPAEGVLTGIYGTAPFMCPEMINGDAYDGKADVWSVGIFAYVMLFGEFPYMPKVPNSKAMKQAILDGVPPKYEPCGDFKDQKRSDVALEFVRALLNRDCGARPCATKALNLAYISACVGERHMPKSTLPSLRPMIHLAKKAGAFEVRDLSKENDMDELLLTMQMQKQTRASAYGNRLAVIVSEAGKTKLPSTASQISNGWENTSSIASSNRSTAWSNTPSVQTTSSSRKSGRKSGLWSNASSTRSKSWKNSSTLKSSNWVDLPSCLSSCSTSASSTISSRGSSPKKGHKRAENCVTDALFVAIAPNV